MNKDSAIIFSDEVQTIINEIVPADDLADFHIMGPVNYINQMFKTEQSLANIETTIDTMQSQVDLVQENIRTLLKDQILASSEGDEALTESMRIIRQLFGEVTGIKTRAENTEEIVKEITRDIKQLDCAKTNLTTSITVLNHLRMLVDGVETLQKLTELRIYNEIMNPLEAVIEVNSHFQSYHDIPQIKVLSNSLEKIKTDLADQILEDFKASFSGKKEKSITFSQLKDACCIASVLDPKVKQNLLSWFLDLQMSEYSQLFHENQDIAWLTKIDKRYSWLKKHLLEFEEKLGFIFPSDWEVSEQIAVRFCNVTRNDLSNLMRKRRAEIDVNLLLFAINKTKHFESLLGKRFSGVTLPKKESESPVDSEEIVNPFENLICECFQAHLDIYLQSVDKNMKELLDRFIQDEENNTSKKQDSSNIFPSAADLFVFYKKCLIQCQQFTNTKSLIDLTLLFKKYLREYAKFVESNVPKAFNQSQPHSTSKTNMSSLTRDLHKNFTIAGNVLQNLLKEGESRRFSSDELIQLCSVIVTAEYCVETVQQLEEKLKEKVPKPFTEQIDFTDEKSIFLTLISSCIQLLVQDVENGCDSALTIMAKKPWHTMKAVGDQSDFINQLIYHFKTVIPLIRDNLHTSRKYFTQLCLKFANAFIAKYITILYKCRFHSADGNSNILGCEQLLLDTHSLKTVLLNLPSIESMVNRQAPANYTKVVVKGMNQAEMIIKIVMTPVSPPQMFNSQVLNLLPEITISEYQKLLDLKALKRQEQVELVELFKAAAGERAIQMEDVKVDDEKSLSKRALNTTSKFMSSSAEQGSRILNLEKLMKKGLYFNS